MLDSRLVAAPTRLRLASPFGKPQYSPSPEQEEAFADPHATEGGVLHGFLVSCLTSFGVPVIKDRVVIENGE